MLNLAGRENLGSDEIATFNGENSGPMFPGVDFLLKARQKVEFPIDVRGKIAVVSIKPFSHNKPVPFTLKPLAVMLTVDVMGVHEIVLT